MSQNHPHPARILHLDASPRGARSLSRQLGRTYLDAVRAARPEVTVVAHDFAHQPPAFVSEAWIEGAFSAPEQRSAPAAAAIAVSDRYVDELLAADELVITTPLYNLSVPAALKAWIDQIVRAGRTFAVTETGYRGLVSGPRALVIVASGGDFRPGTPGAAYNFLEPYLRGILGFIGITAVDFVYAPNLSGGDEARAASLAAARQTLLDRARAAASAPLAA